MAHHTHRKPREIDLALALDELAQVLVQLRRVGTAHQVFGVHAGGVRQAIPGAGLQGVNGLARIKVLQGRAGKGFAVGNVHVGIARVTFLLTAVCGS